MGIISGQDTRDLLKREKNASKKIEPHLHLIDELTFV